MRTAMSGLGNVAISATSDRSKLSIIVRDKLTGWSRLVAVAIGDTVATLKMQLVKILGVPLDAIILHYAGKLLVDTTLIRKYRMCAESVLQLFVRPHALIVWDARSHTHGNRGNAMYHTNASATETWRHICMRVGKEAKDDTIGSGVLRLMIGDVNVALDDTIGSTTSVTLVDLASLSSASASPMACCDRQTYHTALTSIPRFDDMNWSAIESSNQLEFVERIGRKDNGRSFYGGIAAVYSVNIMPSITEKITGRIVMICLFNLLIC